MAVRGPTIPGHENADRAGGVFFPLAQKGSVAQAAAHEPDLGSGGILSGSHALRLAPSAIVSRGGG
eukprot:14672546-Alexandrium_andersonii.AAC.1